MFGIIILYILLKEYFHTHRKVSSKEWRGVLYNAADVLAMLRPSPQSLFAMNMKILEAQKVNCVEFE